MQITDVRIRKVEKEGKMKAVVSITIDDEFVVYQSDRRGKRIVYRDAEQKSRRRRFSGYRTSDQFRDKGSDSGIDTEKV